MYLIDTFNWCVAGVCLNTCWWCQTYVKQKVELLKFVFTVYTVRIYNCDKKINRKSYTVIFYPVEQDMRYMTVYCHLVVRTQNCIILGLTGIYITCMIRGRVVHAGQRPTTWQYQSISRSHHHFLSSHNLVYFAYIKYNTRMFMSMGSIIFELLINTIIFILITSVLAW